MSAVLQTSTHNITEIKIELDRDLQRRLRFILETLGVTETGTGVMKISFSLFGVNTVRWAERDFPDLPLELPNQIPVDSLAR
jgi:hypothetical protein